MNKLLVILVIFLEVFLFVFSKEITDEFILTINIFLYSLLPTMFFQVFLSNILINLDLYKYMPTRICKLFNLNKDELVIILLSIFSGYPNNIKLLSNSENEYLNYVSNYVNPLFIIGTVGYIYLNSIKISIIILISHILSNIVMLYMFKKKYIKNKIIIHKYNNIYNSSIKNTINTLSIIGTNLLFISLITTLLKIVLPFNNIATSIILGLTEFSKGIYEISLTSLNMFYKGLIILIIITFGSISIHFQSISINPKIKYIKFLKFRILNVFISLIIYLLINVLIQLMN